MKAKITQNRTVENSGNSWWIKREVKTPHTLIWTCMQCDNTLICYRYIQ